MDWVTSQSITEWSKRPDAKSNLPLVLSRLIRATTPQDTEIRFPRGADTYTGGWDGVTGCSEKTSFVPKGISLWEMGTEAGVNRKADDDYQKRTDDPLGYDRANSTFIFVSTRPWKDRDKWVAEKKKQNIWKDVIGYNAGDVDQWLRDAPAVGWWFAVLSENMPPDGILSAEQSWSDYTESQDYKLTTQVLTSGRQAEAARVRDFLAGHAAALTTKARSRDEAVAFVIAAGMGQDEQARQDFLAKTLVIEDAQSFRAVANNKYGLNLIAKFEDTRATNHAVTKGHHVFIPIGADDSHGFGDSLVLPQITRELETALVACGLPAEDAHKYMIESGRDLTILRRLLKFPRSSIKWAASEFVHLLLPALFLGRWDEKKEGDIAILETLAGEPYPSYIEKLNRWRNDPDPFVYQIGDRWRLASAFDAWTILASHITTQQLDRFEKTALAVLGQVKPMFDLEPGRRYMAAIYGKESIYSPWAREGISQSLILFALFGDSLRFPVGDSQKWVDNLVGQLLQSDNPDLWRSLNDVMPLIAEAAPDRFLSTIVGAIAQNTTVIMGMFQEDPSPLFPQGYHTGLLWALEGLAWVPQYLQICATILFRLAGKDPGGKLSNRPINSLRSIFIPWRPMTFADRFERDAVLRELRLENEELFWSLLIPLLPADRQTAFPTHETRWRPFGIENRNQSMTYPVMFETYGMIIDLAIPAAGLNETRLVMLLESTASNHMQLKDRNRIFEYLTSIAEQVNQETYEIPAFLNNLLYRHRTHHDQPWALPDFELVAYENLLALYQPKTPVEACRQLFEESHPHFPEMAAIPWRDHEARQKLLDDKRIVAVRAVYDVCGLDGLFKLGREVPEKVLFGDTLAHVLDNPNEQLRLIQELGLNEPDDSNAASGFTWKNAQLKGFNWAEQTLAALRQKGLGPTDLARFLTWVALCSPLYQFLEKQENEIAAEYWKKSKPWLRDLTDEEKAGTIEHLLAAGRGVDAIRQIYLYPSVFGTDLLIRSLREAAATAKWPHRPQSHEVEQVFDELYNRTDYDRTELAQTEWLCLHFISISDRPRYSRLLREELTAHPTFFIQLLEMVFAPEGEQTPPSLPSPETEKKVALAMLADFLLGDWHQIPGLDAAGSIDVEQLNTWIDTARALAIEKRRLDPADLYIGKLLAHYPNAMSGGTPPEPVSDVIDRINTRMLVSGFRDTLHNHHSFSGRGPFDGGSRERGMADHYRGVANNLLLKWPVTASVFQSLVETYELRAVEEDHRAERESLDY